VAGWNSILRCDGVASFGQPPPQAAEFRKDSIPVGLIAGHNSLQAIEAALVELSPFLGTSATVAVLIDSREIGAGLRIRGKLEQMGFRIEAGVRCQQGFVLSAIRHGFGQMEMAA